MAIHVSTNMNQAISRALKTGDTIYASTQVCLHKEFPVTTSLINLKNLKKKKNSYLTKWFLFQIVER